MFLMFLHRNRPTKKKRQLNFFLPIYLTFSSLGRGRKTLYEIFSLMKFNKDK